MVYSSTFSMTGVTRWILDIARSRITDQLDEIVPSFPPSKLLLGLWVESPIAQTMFFVSNFGLAASLTHPLHQKNEGSIRISNKHIILVGGFNPFEKYSSNLEIFPNFRGE